MQEVLRRGLDGQAQQQSSVGAMRQVRAQWWLALRPGPAGGEGERFLSVDEAFRWIDQCSTDAVISCGDAVVVYVSEDFAKANSMFK